VLTTLSRSLPKRVLNRLPPANRSQRPCCVRGPSPSANGQRIAATPSTATQLRGVQCRNSKAPRSEGSEARVKQTGPMFLPGRRSGSPLNTDLERFESRSPRIKALRDLFVTRDRTPVATTNNSCRSRSAS
jgi:hypothetical protein